MVLDKPLIIAIIITHNIIPTITQINELILCFTISVGLSASNLGNLRLIISPIKCDTNGINIDNTNSNKESIILVLNFINKIIFPINNTGVVMNNPNNTLDINIFLVLIGSDFNILIFLPSKLIILLVTLVIKAVTAIKHSINKDVLLTIKSIEKAISFELVSKETTLSYLITTNIVAIMNNNKPNPALIIKTGVLKNVFKSFFTSENVLEVDLIVNELTLTFLGI